MRRVATKTNHPPNTSGKGLRFAIIASRFNEHITEQLVEGASNCLKGNGVAAVDIDILWCPGALEIPALAARVARYGVRRRKPHGIICAGCVIRGETDHYQFVAGEAMRGIGELAARAQVAVGNGVLTVENEKQALERSESGIGNKGWDAALAALEMANHFKAIR